MNPIGKFREDAVKIIPKGMEKFLERPPENIEADLALPCFAMTGDKKKNPVEIAGELANRIKPRGLVKEVRAMGPYVNFYLDWEMFGGLVLGEVLKAGKRFGSGKKGERILLEHTSANPDGPLHLGHFRNTILGDSLHRDPVVVVSAPSDVQKARVLSRPGMTERKFRLILMKQTPDSEKRRRAGYVIDTGVSLEGTRGQVRAVMRKLRAA